LTKEDMERRNLIIPIKKEIDVLIKEIKLLNEAKDNKIAQKDKLLEKLYNIEHGIIPVFKLVYGVHNLNKDAFTYTWINDKGLDIKVGDVVEVNTSCGVERISLLS
jgi:hypothetical protein